MAGDQLSHRRIARQWFRRGERPPRLLRPSGTLAAEFQIWVKKFFARTKVDIYAQVDIDNEFVVKIAQLKCKGEGRLGSFACATLQPLFQRLLEKSFALKSFPFLSDLHLRDLHVAVADTVEITVDFGSG